MEQKNMHPRLRELIAGKILGQELPEEDNRWLEQWLAASDEHQALFQRIKSLEGTKEIIQLESAHYGEEMARRFMQAKVRLVRRPSYRRLKWWYGAAAAIVLLAIAVWSALPGGTDRQEPQTAQTKQEIVPGETKAVLTLAGGQQVEVCRAEATRTGNVFVDTKGQYVTPAADTTWHTLTIPAGGEFRYTLADGTEVWLNSASELRFPATFTDKERRICLRGEAFFDVKKDTCRPFIVALPEGDITVYGTRFVVASYQNTPLSAVLVQGSIGFRAADGQNVRLRPEERLTYETGSGEMRVEKVDVTLYTAWIDKMFIFRGQPLGEIMTTLARWYDLDITFTDRQLRDIRLSGRLNRYQDVRILLHTFEETAGIRFGISGRKIVVSDK